MGCQPFLGEYYSEELDVVYLLTVKDGKLVARIRKTGEPFELEPTIADEFRFPGALLHFNREDGRITGFSIRAGRVKNIRFQRSP